MAVPLQRLSARVAVTVAIIPLIIRVTYRLTSPAAPPMQLIGTERGEIIGGEETPVTPAFIYLNMDFFPQMNSERRWCGEDGSASPGGTV